MNLHILICNFLLKKFFLSVLLRNALIVNAFNTQNCTTVSNIFSVSPRIPNPQMRFHLYTKKNPNESQEILMNNMSSLINSNFNSVNPVRILIHGYKGSHMSCTNAMIKDSYLKNSDLNVIVIDWNDWTNEYYYACNQLPKIGEILGNFTIFLNLSANVSFSNIYLIGHSMGAHVAGIAGTSISPFQYETIFGLDPSGIYHTEATPNNLKLDKSDAKYVETIATSSTLGYNGEIGHARFYPNNKRTQPHCANEILNSMMCNHVAAVKYFAESVIDESNFCAVPCSNYILCISTVVVYSKPTDCSIRMGGAFSTIKDGSFFLETNPTEPYAKGVN